MFMTDQYPGLDGRTLENSHTNIFALVSLLFTGLGDVFLFRLCPMYLFVDGPLRDTVSHV